MVSGWGEGHNCSKKTGRPSSRARFANAGELERQKGSASLLKRGKKASWMTRQRVKELLEKLEKWSKEKARSPSKISRQEETVRSAISSRKKKRRKKVGERASISDRGRKK